ncbi:MAG: hypothetical protein WA435_00225 [Gallionellaceae bacterium]
MIIVQTLAIGKNPDRRELAKPQSVRAENMPAFFIHSCLVGWSIVKSLIRRGHGKRLAANYETTGPAHYAAMGLPILVCQSDVMVA